jgi:excisionase family DNA binding protein
MDAVDASQEKRLTRGREIYGPFWDREEVAGIMQISLATLKRQMKAGKLGYVKVGSRVKVPQSEIDAYLHDHFVKASA